MLRSIRTQMLAGQFVLVAVLTLALGGGVFHVAAGILESKEREKLRLLADGLARETALAAGYAELTLRLAASSQQFADFHATHNFHQLQALFDHYKNAFTALTYVTPEGVREYAAAGAGYTDHAADLSDENLVREALAEPGRVVAAIRPARDEAAAQLTLALARRTAFGENMGALLAFMPITGIAAGVANLRLEEGGGAFLADAEGRLLEVQNTKRLPGLPAAIDGRTPLGLRLAGREADVVLERLGEEIYFVAVAPAGKYGLSVLAALPRRVAIDDKIRRLGLLVAAIAAGAAFCSALVAAWWTGGIARPLARLSEAARAASDGDLTTRVPEAGPTEARDLARAFNAMTRGLAVSREELSRTLRSLESILATMNEAILVVDGKGRLTMLNRAGREMLGYAPDEAEGRPAAMLFPEGEPLVALLESAERKDWLAGGGMMGLEKSLVAKGGRTVPVLVSVALLRGPRGEEEGALCLAMDITERKRIEDLTRARKSAESISRAKTEFLAVLSHEMRTPLNIILGILELFADQPLPAPTRQGVNQAMTAGQALLDVIVAMLDYATLEAGRLLLRRQPFCPETLAGDLAGRFAGEAARRGLTLSVDVAPDMPDRLLGDPQRLNQAVANLLSNAVRFTSAGTVELALALLPPDAAPGAPRRLLVRVSDTGAGVSDAKLEYIFEPFTQEDASSTRRFGGLGLGLAITRRLVGLMGGTICMDSRLGDGTDVFVSLPVEPVEKDAGES